MCELKNTIKFIFSDGGDKPKIEEVVNFVKTLDADRNQILAAYRISEEKAIFFKFKSEESMLHALTYNSDDLIFHYGNGKEAKVYMTYAQECIYYVRVYDLPPEIPGQELASVLGKYGRVKHVVQEKFPVELGLDAFTGVRGACMDVKKEIPTSLHFLNRKENIFYPSNNSKCFLCKEEGHRMIACPKRKARIQLEQCRPEQEQSASGSFAGAVIGGKVTGGPVIVGAVSGGLQSDNSHQETIEMREMEATEAAMAPTAPPAEENSNNETSEREDENQNSPLNQLASAISAELKRKTAKMRQRREAKEEEQAKLKSPPRKKKTFSSYKK